MRTKVSCCAVQVLTTQSIHIVEHDNGVIRNRNYRLDEQLFVIIRCDCFNCKQIIAAITSALKVFDNYCYTIRNDTVCAIRVCTHTGET